jgi:hypothetical protein
MIRRVAFTLALAAMVCSMNAALAGGGSSGSSKSNSQYVRIKNIGSATALVNAANGGSVSTASGGKSLGQNGVAQFNLKKSPGVAAVTNAARSKAKTLPYNFPKSTYVYLQAQADAGAASITFAPPGTRF